MGYPNSENGTNSFGLLANGTSRLWSISIDESLEGKNEWFAEIEGPQTYLVFQLNDLKTIGQITTFLEQRLGTTATQRRNDMLKIGSFGKTAVSVLWDNEEVPRCFIVIGSPTAISTVRISLLAEDIQMFLQALHQASQDLPGQ